jgi:hypothetical protein
MKKIIPLYFLLFLFSCNREDSDSEVIIDKEEEYLDEYMDILHIGIIYDENGEKLKSANVSFNQSESFTNDQGVYIFPYSKTNLDGEVIKIKNKGYFDKYHYVITEANDISNSKIKLKKLANASRIKSNEAFTLSLDKGSVSFKPSIYTYEDGRPYIGEVYFYTEKINPYVFPIRDSKKNNYVLQGDIHNIAITDKDLIPLSLSEMPTITSSTEIYYLNTQKDCLSDYNSFSKPKELNIIGFGRKTEASLVKFTIEKDNKLITNGTINIEFDNLVYPKQLSQKGVAYHYLPLSSKGSANPLNSCNTINATDVTIGLEKKQSKKITIKNDITSLMSKLASCNGGKIQDSDLTYMLVKSANEEYVTYVNEDNVSLNIENCEKIEDITFYNAGLELLKIVNPQVTANSLSFDISDFCVSKILGYICINGKYTFYTKEQFIITRENTISNLTVTDLSGIFITGNNVVGNGNYIVDIFLSNRPDLLDCNGNCQNVKLNVKQIGKIGDPISLTINGNIDGKIVNGKFENTLLK